MAQFKTLTANFTVSTMVEHGTLAFFLDDDPNPKFSGTDFTANNKMVLSPGEHSYQWQVNGKRGITRYSIRLLLNGTPIPATSIGPRTLQNGDTDFDGGPFTVS